MKSNGPKPARLVEKTWTFQLFLFVCVFSAIKDLSVQNLFSLQLVLVPCVCHKTCAVLHYSTL